MTYFPRGSKKGTVMNFLMIRKEAPATHGLDKMTAAAFILEQAARFHLGRVHSDLGDLAE